MCCVVLRQDDVICLSGVVVRSSRNEPKVLGSSPAHLLPSFVLSFFLCFYPVFVFLVFFCLFILLFFYKYIPKYITVI